MESEGKLVTVGEEALHGTLNDAVLRGFLHADDVLLGCAAAEKGMLRRVAAGGGIIAVAGSALAFALGAPWAWTALAAVPGLLAAGAAGGGFVSLRRIDSAFGEETESAEESGFSVDLELVDQPRAGGGDAKPNVVLDYLDESPDALHADPDSEGESVWTSDFLPTVH